MNPMNRILKNLLVVVIVGSCFVNNGCGLLGRLGGAAGGAAGGGLGNAVRGAVQAAGGALQGVLRGNFAPGGRGQQGT